MSFYGRSNRILVEQTIQRGIIKDSQISECDLSNLRIADVRWDHTDIRNLHANDIVIQNTKLEKSSFFRSSFMRASLNNSLLDTMVLDGLTLIKSRWQNSRITNTTMKNLCLQRASFSRLNLVSSSFLDFEALDSRMDNCVFAHSTISVSYGSGMNGFSNADITNCIFYHCRFEGYPFRGAKIASCAFVYCSGEIGDDMECRNVAGIGLRGKAQHKGLQKMTEGRRLLERFAS